MLEFDSMKILIFISILFLLKLREISSNAEEISSLLQSQDRTVLVEWTKISHETLNYNLSYGGSCGISSNGSIVINGFNEKFLYISNDFGKHWTLSTIIGLESLPSGRWLNTISGDGKHAYGIYGLLNVLTLYRSEDFGRTFEMMPSDIYGANTIYSFIQASSTGEYMILIANRDISPKYAVYIYNDFGRNQSSAIYPPNDYSLFQSVVLDKNDRIYINYDNNYIYNMTPDFGKTWQTLQNMPYLPWNYIAFDRSLQNGVALYYNEPSKGFQFSGVYYTRNGGLTWLESNLPPLLYSVGMYMSLVANYDSGKYVNVYTFTGYIWSSSDYGATFVINSESALDYWYNMAVDNSGEHLIATNYYAPQTDPYPVYVGTRWVGECAPGQFYTPDNNAESKCSECPVGTYTSDYNTMSQCDVCRYPWTSSDSGSTECRQINIYLGLITTTAILAVMFVIVAVCIAVDKQRLPVALNLFFPTLDVFTDIAYLLTSEFYRPLLFILCVLFILWPVPLFIYILWEVGAVPRLFWRVSDAWWLSWSRDRDVIYYAKFPCLGRRGRFPIISMRSHHNLRHLILECVMWVIAISAQIMSLGVWLCIVPFNIVFLVVWFIVGVFLHLTNLIALGWVSNIWFRVWTGSALFATNIDVDTEALNEGLKQHVMYESAPQLALQIVDSVYLNRLSPVACVSIVMSLVNMLVGMWRFVYFPFCVDSSVPSKDVPFGWISFGGELEPKSKRGSRLYGGQKIPLFDAEEEAEGHDPRIVNDNGDEVEPTESHQSDRSRNKEYSAVVLSGLLESDAFIRDANPVEATLVFNYSAQTAPSYPAVTSEYANMHSTAQPFNEWLMDQLVAFKVDRVEAKTCALQLVSAGVCSQEHLASLSYDQFDRAFLTHSVGVTKRSMQNHLLSIHSLLHDV